MGWYMFCAHGEHGAGLASALNLPGGQWLQVCPGVTNWPGGHGGAGVGGSTASRLTFIKIN